ncbi:hypothetical protein P4B35_16780 [Pontiellaceae bacterium B12227]|nr:hypothetical protein [Pontiellaceae bacterium B12227]
MGWFVAVLLFAVYSLTAPQNHSEAEDVYDFALKVEQGTFADQAGVNRVLALPMFGMIYRAAQTVGYSGRAFPFMIFINRLLAVGCFLLFWRLLGGLTALSALGRDRARPSTNAYCLLPATLLFSFSYGFWRYANEAETYVLASVFVLGAWCLVLRGNWVWSVGVSALGILVHLLNLIPLLLIIPLFYLLSKDWKKALLHGVLTGLLVVVGYAVCSPWLDFSELGAQHHAAEGAVSLKNMLRGGIAFGQNVVSANFLFGFESFRELLTNLFPSRMLDEEFYMASKMGAWISWAGGVTVVVLAGVGVWVYVRACRGVLGYGSKGVKESGSNGRTDVSSAPGLMPNTFILSTIVWLLLYAFAVIRTEAGSPELWIMALIPFWLIVALCLNQFIFGHQKAQESQNHGRGRKTASGPEGPTPRREDSGQKKANRGQRTEAGELRVRAQHPAAGAKGPTPKTKYQVASPQALWLFAALLFCHNLIAGLLPVMSAESDYHAVKGKWLVENCGPEDLILTDYEPVMIFYLDYFTESEILNSGQLSLNQIKEALGSRRGKAYAVSSFFQPMEAMRVRSPSAYDKMRSTGETLLPEFDKIADDEFGGTFCLRQSMGVVE